MLSSSQSHPLFWPRSAITPILAFRGRSFPPPSAVIKHTSSLPKLFLPVPEKKVFFFSCAAYSGVSFFSFPLFSERNRGRGSLFFVLSPAVGEDYFLFRLCFFSFGITLPSPVFLFRRCASHPFFFHFAGEGHFRVSSFFSFLREEVISLSMLKSFSS